MNLAGNNTAARHQRCLNAIAAQPGDRAPTYIPAIACEVASKILGRPAHTGTGSLHYAEVSAWAKGGAAHAEFEARLCQDIIELHRILDIDVIRMPWRMNIRPSAQLDDNTFVFGDLNGDHRVCRYNPQTADFGELRRVVVTPPTETDPAIILEQLEKDLATIQSAAPDVPSSWLDFYQMAGDEFFVVYTGGGVTVGMSEQDLMDLALIPKVVGCSLMLQSSRAIRQAEGLIQHGCPRVMLGGGDLASNTGLLYSPKQFREVVLPAYRHLTDRMNALGVHYAFRSDGNLWSIADMLFQEAACPGYGETDRDAGMTVAKLRQRYPGLVIWGNMSSALLQRATPQQVRDESRRILDESGGVGYFHGCSNAIVNGTPPENVEAMFSIR